LLSSFIQLLSILLGGLAAFNFNFHFTFCKGYATERYK